MRSDIIQQSIRFIAVVVWTAATSLSWADTSTPPGAGRAPDSAQCADAKGNPVLEGGCLAITRSKGNCQACHLIAGIPSGNIAPPLVSMAARFPDRARLRHQIQNPAQFNPDTVMPPYGAHKILTQEEIDKIVEWVLTL